MVFPATKDLDNIQVLEDLQNLQLNYENQRAAHIQSTKESIEFLEAIIARALDSLEITVNGYVDKINLEYSFQSATLVEAIAQSVLQSVQELINEFAPEHINNQIAAAVAIGSANTTDDGAHPINRQAVGTVQSVLATISDEIMELVKGVADYLETQSTKDQHLIQVERSFLWTLMILSSLAAQIDQFLVMIEFSFTKILQMSANLKVTLEQLYQQYISSVEYLNSRLVPLEELEGSDESTS